MEKALVWLRRDLRLKDHAALSQATQRARSVALVFVFDSQILGRLGNPQDRRLTFIWESLNELRKQIQKKGSDLILIHGDPVREIPPLAEKLGVSAVFANRDYEPYARTRDQEVMDELRNSGRDLHLFKDHVLFEGPEILSGGGGPYRVFTPYLNAWKKQFRHKMLEEHPVSLSRLMPLWEIPRPNRELSLKDLGFHPQTLWLPPGERAAQKRLDDFMSRIDEYDTQRDIPGVEGTSGLSVHLRFGTCSVRQLFRKALEKRSKGRSTWLKELVWREFYQMILDRFPHVVHQSFKDEYRQLKWPGEPEHFQAWCEGRTGFPIIDAAMRHFAKTGWMHNRLRMIVASFLTKDLLVSWQEGEAFFAAHLLDFDLASNNGGWQWAASTGCDAQPYFRIFSPWLQSQRFDPQGDFIRRALPELQDVPSQALHKPEKWAAARPPTYPAPIVDHSLQREKALKLFSQSKQKASKGR